MARRSKPWYRSDRRSWFVSIDGVRHNLGPNKKCAFARFHEMMVRPVKRRLASDSLVTIIDAFLEWCQNHRAADTYQWYRDRLQRFADIHPNLTTRDLRPFHVQQWLDGMHGLASGSKRNYCRAVKRVMRWAQQQGYIDFNPIAMLEQPKAGRREQVICPDEFGSLLELAVDRSFRDLLVTTWETGCRPQESLRVEARHVDLTNSRWVFPESEGKGEMLRIVYLTDEALAITKRLMLHYPEGKLFRNSKGVAWTTDAVNCAFTRLQTKAGRLRMRGEELHVEEAEVTKLAATLRRRQTVRGQVVEKSESDLAMEARRKLRNRLASELAPKYSLYVLRHSWATHALERGLDALTVAVLMGHRDPGTLAKVYQHLAHNPSFLREQAKRAVG
jgi:integrase